MFTLHASVARKIFYTLRYGVLLISLTLCIAASAEDPWSPFTATALNGEAVSSDKLLGQPTLLIITPSKEAAASTREWVAALRDNIKQKKYRIRDVLAVNLPFFMSEEDAISRAKEAIPERYHEHTWILNSAVLEKALGIPRDSDIACITVLNTEGKVIARVHGDLNDKRLSTVVEALKTLR